MGMVASPLYLLTETGDHLLLEDGSGFVLLEEGGGLVFDGNRENYTGVPGRVTAPKDGPYLIGSVYRARGRR